MKFLLIGGTWDGRAVDIEPGRDYLRLHKLLPMPIHPTQSVVPEPIEDEIYIKELFMGQERDFFMFRHSEIFVDDMIERLIAGYKPAL